MGVCVCVCVCDTYELGSVSYVDDSVLLHVFLYGSVSAHARVYLDARLRARTVTEML